MQFSISDWWIPHMQLDLVPSCNDRTENLFIPPYAVLAPGTCSCWPMATKSRAAAEANTDPRVTGRGVRSVSPDFQKQQAGRKPPSINYSFGGQCSESNEVKILMCSMLPDHLQSDPSTNLMCCDERMPSTRFVARSYSLRPSPKVGRFRSLRRELRRGRKVEGALKTPDRHRFVLGG
jgi:hypothetical protein